MTDHPEVRGEISLEDNTAATLRRIEGNLDHLAHKFHETGDHSEHLNHAHVWAGLTEHVDVLREHFGGLRASVGEFGSSLTELLPAFAAFGAVGSVAGLFELTEHTAEAYAQLTHMAAELGLATEELHKLDFVAKMTDTSVEAMHTGMSRLNKAIAEAADGRNKNAASLFSHLGIALRDANGHLRSSTDLLPELANAFQHTGDAAMRTRMAMTLMGRGGAEMIPMLMLGGEELEKLGNSAKKLQFDPTREQREGLLRYADTMKELRAAVGAFQDEVGADLAPVLTPLIHEAEEWITAHRSAIAQFASGRLKVLGDWVEGGGIERAEHSVEALAGGIDHVVQEFGGWGRAVEFLAGLMAVKGALFLAEPVIELAKLSAGAGKFVFHLGEMALGWGKVGAAATEAAAAERAAVNVHGAPAITGEAGSAAAGAGLAGPRAPVVGAAVLGLNLVNAGIQASQGANLTKEDIAAFPHLADGLSADQIAKLPSAGNRTFAGIELPDWLNKPLPGLDVLEHFGDWLLKSAAKLDQIAMPGGGIAGERYPDSAPGPSLVRVNGTGAAPSLDLPKVEAPLTDMARSLGPGGRIETPLADMARALQQGGQIKMTVDFANVPPGVAVTATGTGLAANPTLNLGQAFGGNPAKPGR